MSFDPHLKDSRLNRVISGKYEGKSVEYKEFLDFDNLDHRIGFVKEVISLAHTGGGYLVLGVADDEYEAVGVSKNDLPDESRLNDLVDKYINHSITIELRNYSYKDINCPVIFVEDSNLPLIITQGTSGKSEELNKGVIYWRDGGSVIPLSDTNQLVSFFSKYTGKIEDERRLSVESFLSQKEPEETSETLLSNIFITESVPDYVYLASSMFNRREETIKHIYREEGIPRSNFILWEGNLVTFDDLTEDKCYLKAGMDSKPDKKPFEDWKSDQNAKHHIQLLNNSFYDFCAGKRGLSRDLEKNRLYFKSVNGSKEVYWHPNKAARREIVKYLPDLRLSPQGIYAHKALKGGFIENDDVFYLYLDSTWVYTYDGDKKIIREKIPNSVSNKLHRLERNWQYLQNIRFWASHLAGPEGKMDIGEDYKLRVNLSKPVETDLAVGSSEGYKSEFEFEPDKYEVYEVK